MLRHNCDVNNHWFRISQAQKGDRKMVLEKSRDPLNYYCKVSFHEGELLKITVLVLL